ncbi:BZIP domain-containing protein [Pycnococcus provasolii]
MSPAHSPVSAALAHPGNGIKMEPGNIPAPAHLTSLGGGGASASLGKTRALRNQSNPLGGFEVSTTTLVGVPENFQGRLIDNNNTSCGAKRKKMSHTEHNDTELNSESEHSDSENDEEEVDVVDELLKETGTGTLDHSGNRPRTPVSETSMQATGIDVIDIDLNNLKEGDERLEAAKANMNRKDRRRLANRMSARRARQRRIQQVEDLEAELRTLNQEHDMTKQRLVAAEATMRNLLATNEQMSRRLMQCGVHPNEINSLMVRQQHPQQPQQPSVSLQAVSHMSMETAQQVPTTADAPPPVPQHRQHVPEAPPAQQGKPQMKERFDFRRSASGGFLNMLDEMPQEMFLPRRPSFAQQDEIVLPKLSFVPSIGDFFASPQYAPPKAA